MKRLLSVLLLIAQAVLAGRVLARMARTSDGVRIAPVATQPAKDGVTVILPVLNEEGRLGPCLAGLMAQSAEVTEILVVDGGSSDGTAAVVEAAAAQDPRVRWIDASPVPARVNGKAHNLQAGLVASNPASRWILTIDADVRPAAMLVPSILAHASGHSLRALSVATRQRLASAPEGLLHPSMLTTLVYRFGIPGSATTRVEEVQANGQCFLAERSLLLDRGGFAAVRESICEDVTIARAIAAHGVPVGFYEGVDLVDVEMYSSWQETWTNWSRSLPMRDRYVDRSAALGLAEVTLVQALPLAVLAFGRPDGLLRVLNIALVFTRFGVLAGMRRAYADAPPTYWLSPLCDLPVAGRLWFMFVRRQHRWRGRQIIRGGS